MSAVSLTEAARAIGISRTQLYRMLGDNRLHDFDRGHGPGGTRLVELDGLKAACLNRMQWRADSPALGTSLEWGPSEDQALAALNDRLSQLVDEAASEVGHPPRLAQLAASCAEEGFAFLEAITRP